MGPGAVQCLLIIAFCNFTMPHSSPSRLPTFADEQITFTQSKHLARIGIEIHCEDFRKIKVEPLYICITQIRSLMISCLLFLVEHFSKSGFAHLTKTELWPCLRISDGISEEI